MPIEEVPKSFGAGHLEAVGPFDHDQHEGVDRKALALQVAVEADEAAAAVGTKLIRWIGDLDPAALKAAADSAPAGDRRLGLPGIRCERDAPAGRTSHPTLC